MSPTTNEIISQDLKEHQWDNRLVLLLVEDTLDENYQQQIENFERESKGLEDRKLIIYQVQKNQYKAGLEKEDWKSSDHLWKKYKKTEAPFEFILIGLDGGVKLRKTDYFSTEELYKIIDVMPMRMQELRKGK